MITTNSVKSVIESGLEVSYKLLYMGKIKLGGKEYIQVHCDRYNLQYSHLYKEDSIDLAVSKFMSLHAQYLISELKNKEKTYGLP